MDSGGRRTEPTEPALNQRVQVRVTSGVNHQEVLVVRPRHRPCRSEAGPAPPRPMTVTTRSVMRAPEGPAARLGNRGVDDDRSGRGPESPAGRLGAVRRATSDRHPRPRSSAVRAVASPIPVLPPRTATSRFRSSVVITASRRSVQPSRARAPRGFFQPRCACCALLTWRTCAR